MDPILAGVIGMALFLLLMFVGVPIPFAAGLAGIAGVVMIMGFQLGLNLVATIPFTSAASYSLTVMPLFVLMSELCFQGGLTTDAYMGARDWFGDKRGGLAITSTVASAIFGAVCGAGSTTAMVMTQAAWPEMKRYKYDPKLGLGSIAAAGPLATLIPPSMPFITYALLADVSVGKMFTAGWIPGIITCIILCITIVIIVRVHPDYAPRTEKLTFLQRLKSIKRFWAIALLIIIVFGSMWGGLCTVNEAAGIGAIGALIIGFAKRRLTLKSMLQSVKNVAVTSVAVYFVLSAMSVFNTFMALSGVPRALAAWVASLPLSPMGIMWVIIVLYLILGCFLDAPPILMLTVPLLAPVINALGFDLVWFGVIVTMTAAIGSLTPPVGICLFVMRNNVPEVSFGDIVKGSMPFMVSHMVALVLFMYIPQLVTWLPNLLR